MAIQQYKGSYTNPTAGSTGNAVGAIGQFLTGLGGLSQAQIDRQKKDDQLAFEQGMETNKYDLETQKNQMESQKTSALVDYYNMQKEKMAQDLEYTTKARQDIQNVMSGMQPTTEEGLNAFNKVNGITSTVEVADEQGNPVRYGIKADGSKVLIGQSYKAPTNNYSQSNQVFQEDGKYYTRPFNSRTGTYGEKVEVYVAPTAQTRQDAKELKEKQAGLSSFAMIYSSMTGKKLDLNNPNQVKAVENLLAQSNNDAVKAASVAKEYGGIENLGGMYSSANTAGVTEPMKLDGKGIAIGEEIVSDLGEPLKVIGADDNGNPEFARTNKPTRFNDAMEDPFIKKLVLEGNDRIGIDKQDAAKVVKFLTDSGASLEGVKNFLDTRTKIDDGVFQAMFGDSEEFMKDFSIDKDMTEGATLATLGELLNNGQITFDKTRVTKSGLPKIKVNSDTFKTLDEAVRYYKKYGDTSGFVGKYTENPDDLTGIPVEKK